MYDTLVEPQVLLAHSATPDWCVLDCRASLADPLHGQQAYAAAHIPGAVFADLATDLSGPLVPRVSGRHPLPDPEALAGTFGRWGIDATTQVVAYDAANGAFAARAWWLLRWLGHGGVAVLNGGFAAWQAAGYAVRSGVEHRPRARFEARASLTRTVGAMDILDGGDTLALLDARSEIRFSGEHEPIDLGQERLDHFMNQSCGEVIRAFADGRDGGVAGTELLAQAGGSDPSGHCPTPASQESTEPETMPLRTRPDLLPLTANAGTIGV